MKKKEQEVSLLVEGGCGLLASDKGLVDEKAGEWGN